MADIASSDVVVTVERRAIEGKTRRNRVKIVFGNGTLTYPAGGIPMPSFGSFGMVRNLDYLTVFDEDNASGAIWKYDRTNNKLRCYVQGAAVGAAGAVAMDDFPVTAAFGTDAALSLSLTGTAGAGTHRWGALKEVVASTDAPASTTLVAEAVGW